MGNGSSREQRRQSTSPSDRPTTSAGAPASPSDRLNPPVYASRIGRGSRPDLSFLGIGSSSNVEVVEARRESKQEREARKLEKERVNRLKERERSMREEHVDGGYLVTQGVYTGIEDFNKSIVRQFMIERRIAPFWRGLEDYKDDWTEHQLVAAARGLPIPAADEIPPEDPTRSPSAESQTRSNTNVQNLMVPITARSQSYASDFSATLSPSHPAFSPTSTTPPVISPPPHSSSPFRPRSKTLASLTTSSRNPSQSDIVPREVQLPRDPYVNGQAIEAFLYKDATECPICFIYYPPYLNKTRCCDQPICSECFVQIKRPDPHPPEHADPSNPTTEQVDPETLVSEPSTCPYCQQAEFGVTYEPPPFRRGLSYANMANLASAMSSSSSINSDGSPIVPTTQRRRTTSISANNSSVITTDRIRPDWATKLNNARNHAARRSAAATALHTAAYLMGNNGGSEGRGFLAGRSRFGRSREARMTPPETAEAGGRNSSIGAFAALAERHATMSRGNNNNPPPITNRRRSRLDDLEDMMMNEAIRLSLAAEEERAKKEEKEKKKTEKKKEKEREKEAKKAEKAARKSMYGGGSSASGSTLSLSLPGRRRGNSTNSSLFRDLSNTDKGKNIDRGNNAGPGGLSALDGSITSPVDIGRNHVPTSLTSGNTGPLQHSDTVHTPTVPTQSSHLRYMSNASSPASSYVESINGSPHGHHHGSNSSLGDSPDASGINVSGLDEHSGAANTESMFNFRRLAETIGEEDAEDKAEATKHVEYLGGESSHELGAEARNGDSEASREDSYMERSVATVKPSDNEDWSTPALMITPVTPASIDDETSKQLEQGIFQTVEARELV